MFFIPKGIFLSKPLYVSTQVKNLDCIMPGYTIDY